MPRPLSLLIISDDIAHATVATTFFRVAFKATYALLRRAAGGFYFLLIRPIAFGP
jgi:hypothetical protein